MKKYILFLSLFWLFSLPTFAADNAITITNGSDVVLKSKDLGAGVQLLQRGLLDTAGAEILGLVTASPAANTIGARLVTINTTLGSPLQAGGNVAITKWASGTLGAMANYGTSPGAVLVPGVNAFVTNANANGQAIAANSSPVVLPLTQVAIVATGAAPPTNATYLGANASGATGGHVAGLITCDSHIFKHITSATDTLAVQGVASQTIYICGWRSRAAGVATWFLENTASANANCSSANTQLTGVATEAANTGETILTAFWSGLKNTSGNGLCINSTGTGGVDVDVWYAQF